MRSGITALLNVVLILTVTLVLVGPARPVSAAPDGATEDILYLEDGRVLHGEILTEDRSVVVFNYVDRTVGAETKLRLLHSEILKIERDVPLGDTPQAADEPADNDQPARRRSSSSSNRTGLERYISSRPSVDTPIDENTIGVRRGGMNEEGLTSIYIVPMEGQMGTDVSTEVYEEIAEDIRLAAPDLLVVQMLCLDQEDRINSRITEQDRGLDGIGFLDIYREVLNIFHDELRDIPQVCWVHDSLGVSSVLAMSWNEMYMTPEARLGGVARAARNFAIPDPDVLGKYREAYMAMFRGFILYNDNDFELIEAMVRPELKLGATWRGRTVDWHLDGSGEYVIDNSDEHTVSFRANGAERFCISDGTAETLDDVALLHGIREYRLVDGQARAIFDDFREDWRRAFESCETHFQDYEQYISWARGEDTLAYLGKAKSSVEKALSAIRRYKAVETRLAYDYGIRAFDLETIVEQLREQIRSLKRDGRVRGGGGGGGRGGAGPGSR